MNTAKLLSVGEHAHYPFKSYPNTTCETVLFPGCSVSSQFPKTTDALALRCRQAGFGVVYDCCGSPVEGYGEHKSAQRLMRGLIRRLERIGCKRLVLMCPSCAEQLEGKVPFELVNIFDILDELGLEDAGSFGEGKLFIPCPDRQDRTMESSLRASCDLSKVETMTSAPCCGLKPVIASRGSAYSSKLGKTVISTACRIDQKMAWSDLRYALEKYGGVPDVHRYPFFEEGIRFIKHSSYPVYLIAVLCEHPRYGIADAG